MGVAVLVVVVGCLNRGRALLWSGVMEVADHEEVEHEQAWWQW